MPKTINLLLASIKYDLKKNYLNTNNLEFHLLTLRHI